MKLTLSFLVLAAFTDRIPGATGETMKSYHRLSAKMASMYALMGALLLGVMGASEADDCPAYCSCNSYSTHCALSHTNISVIWTEDSLVFIRCTDNGNFTFEEFPRIDAGPKPILLQLNQCSLPPSFELAASRLSAQYIQKLDISDAPDEITAAMVGGLEQLETLAIYRGWTVTPHKQLVALPSEVFARMPNLKTLVINMPNVSIHRGDFASIPALTILELNSCLITRLPDAVFSPLNKLEKLSLFFNKLEELSAEQLQGLNSLQELDISLNQLRSLRGLAATHIPLQILRASTNYFDELPPLSNLIKLQEFQLAYNIEKPLKIAPRALASLPHLRTVILSSNGIQHIPNDTFSNLSALKKLDLTRNKFTSLAPGVFSDLTSLEELDLRFCRLRALDAKVFRSLQALQTLRLDHNLLTSLPPNGMVGLSSLRHLSVTHNNLLSLTNSMLLGASALVTVDFRYNNMSDPQTSQLMDLSQFNITYQSSLAPRQHQFARWHC